MFESDENKPKKPRCLRKITKIRLKNIALYYLKRFESSTANLRNVLQRRVNDYARQVADFDKYEAYDWIEEILTDFQNLKYLDDNRYTEIKVQDYLNAGKSERYIKGKLREKGIEEKVADKILDSHNFNPFDNALKLAKKKRIGPYRESEEARKEFRQKDMRVLVSAGFDYDVALEVLNFSI